MNYIKSKINKRFETHFKKGYIKMFAYDPTKTKLKAAPMMIGIPEILSSEKGYFPLRFKSIKLNQSCQLNIKIDYQPVKVFIQKASNNLIEKMKMKNPTKISPLFSNEKVKDFLSKQIEIYENQYLPEHDELNKNKESLI